MNAVTANLHTTATCIRGAGRGRAVRLPLLWTFGVIGTGKRLRFRRRCCRTVSRPISSKSSASSTSAATSIRSDHLLTVVWTVLVCSLAAIRSHGHFRCRRLVFTVILATLMLPTEINFLVNFITTTHLRLVNTYAGVILPTLAGAIGIFIMKNAFEEIPQDLLDAARVDGASELHIFFRIMLPLALPQIGALVILTTVTS
jgi:ABC-type spermidine/putrescine transport system permease subunit II